MGLIQSFRDYRESLQPSGQDFTLLSPSDRQEAAKAFRMTFQSYGQNQAYGTPWGQFLAQFGFGNNRSKINYALEVGDLRLSSLVMAAVNWVATNLCSARLYVASVGSDGKEKEIPDHPMIQLWDSPNPFYSSADLLSGCAMSWVILSEIDILEIRSRVGYPAQLWYEPWWSIRPHWPPDGSEFIDYYEVERNGVWKPIDTDEVLVLTKGRDPVTRRAFNSMLSLMPELFTDQQGARFAAQMFRSGFVPPLVAALGSKDVPFHDPDGTKFPAFIETLTRKMSGDQAGEPLVVTGPVDVQKLGFEYDKVGIKQMRETPEARFCSVMGISPISLMLGAGIDISTYSNVEQYLKHDYRSYIIPLQTRIAEMLRRQLLPDFGDEDLIVKWDYTDSPLMQPDKNAEWDRVGQAFERRVLNRAQALEAINYTPEPGDEDVYYPVASSSITISPLTEATLPAPQLPPSPEEPSDEEPIRRNGKVRFRVKQGDLDDAAAYYQRLDGLSEQQRLLMSAE